MRRFPVLLCALVSVVAFCGCAHYEFRLVQPSNFAQTIGKQAVTIHYDPLDYRLAARGSALGMRVVNPTDAPVTLLSPKSYVVDPAGETHPLRGRSIAPHSYIGMSLPPVARLYSSGYYGGFGMGYGYGYYDPFFMNARFGHPFYYPYYGFYDPFFYAPPVYAYPATPYDWEWKTGEVRLKLEYERGGTNFVHNFVFERQRVK